MLFNISDNIIKRRFKDGHRHVCDLSGDSYRVFHLGLARSHRNQDQLRSTLQLFDQHLLLSPHRVVHLLGPEPPMGWLLSLLPPEPNNSPLPPLHPALCQQGHNLPPQTEIKYQGTPVDPSFSF